MSEDRLEVRMACRQRHPLDGADAQALEGALQQVETELEQSRAEVKRLHENKNVEMVRRIENCLEIAIDRAENAEDEVKRLKERFADG